MGLIKNLQPIKDQADRIFIQLTNVTNRKSKVDQNNFKMMIRLIFYWDLKIKFIFLNSIKIFISFFFRYFSYNSIILLLIISNFIFF